MHEENRRGVHIHYFLPFVLGMRITVKAKISETLMLIQDMVGVDGEAGGYPTRLPLS